MGLFTQRAVEQVLDHLRAQSFVRQDRMGLAGISRGAIVAGVVARAPCIRAMVLNSSAYDRPARVGPNAARRRGGQDNGVVDEIRSGLTRETDGSVNALEDRAVLPVADRIRTPALIINRAHDDRTDPEQARALAETIQASGVSARAIIYPDDGHAIPYDVRERDVRPFLDQYLR